MDRVTVSLQNKELIEEIINSSDEVRAKIHNAIIDGVSKRIAKNVISNMESSIKYAIEKVQDELLSKYMDGKRMGWSTIYDLKKEYKEEVRNEVRRAWDDEIRASVAEIKEKVAASYEERLRFAYEAYVSKIEKMTEHLDDKIKEAVDENISKRFSK